MFRGFHFTSLVTGLVGWHLQQLRHTYLPRYRLAFLFDDCKVVGLSPIRVEVGSFSTLIGFLIELGVLLAKWEGWEHIAKLHSLYKWVFEGVALQYLTFTPG